MRNMKHNMLCRTFGAMVYGGFLALCCTGCSSENPEYVPGTGDAVRIASVKESLRTETIKTKSMITKSEITPANGDYYLGYKTEVGGVATSPVQKVTVTDGTIAETGLYWTNILKDEASGESIFTLSNVDENEEKEPVFPEDNDILWGECSAWMKALDFTLSHRMAAVRVKLELDIPTGQNVEQVSLTAIQRKYTFNRSTGVVVLGTGNVSEMILKEVSETSPTEWYELLPPQGWIDDMELKVVVKDGTSSKTYKRALPYSMIESIGSGQSQSIPLEFRAGYRLMLTAKVTDNIDYTVFFTGATLQDWKYEGSHSVVAKSAGIYTETELKDWAKKYNAYIADKSEKNKNALLRYGTESGGKWTFTLSRDIEVTNKADLEKVSMFYDELVRLNSYRITGIVQTDLFAALDAGASVTSGIFQ